MLGLRLPPQTPRCPSGERWSPSSPDYCPRLPGMLIRCRGGEQGGDGSFLDECFVFSVSRSSDGVALHATVVMGSAH